MKSVLCYGDSNTWGYEPETDSRLLWEERYPGILGKKLGFEYQVIEDGLCGRTTCFESVSETYVNGVKGAKLCAVINAPIDIAVIMLGTNDCKDEYGADLVTIGLGLEQIAQIFEKAGARVIIIAPPPLRNLNQSPFFAEFGKGAEKRSEGLALCYQNLAARHGWEFLNAGDILLPGEFDKIHLDKAGHQKLAESVYDMIAGGKGQ